MAFTHLHVHTEYSLLDGSNKIKEYVARVKELGMNSAAITDHGVMYGVIDFYKEAKAQGINPILGCEVYVAPNSRFDRETVHGEDRYYHLVLLAENNTGYSNLMKIVSKGFVDGYYYKPRVDMEVLEQYHEGIIALSACLAGEVPRAITRGNYEEAKEIALKYQKCFGKENYFLELQDHGIPEQQNVNQHLLRMSQELGSSSGNKRISIIPMPRMQNRMISFFVYRPEKKWPMRTECVMRAGSIMSNPNRRWQNCFPMQDRPWKIHRRSQTAAMLK